MGADLGALRRGGSGSPRKGSGGYCTFSSSSTTSMCTSPRTDSPLMWVMRSPARRPASWAGLPSSTLWQWGRGGRSCEVWEPTAGDPMPSVSAVGPQQPAAAHAVSLTLGAVQRVTGREGRGSGLGGGGTTLPLCTCGYGMGASRQTEVSTALSIPVCLTRPPPHKKEGLQRPRCHQFPAVGSRTSQARSLHS